MNFCIRLSVNFCVCKFEVLAMDRKCEDFCAEILHVWSLMSNDWDY